MASKLLIAESPLQLLPTLAALVGVSEGLVLQQLHYESLRSRDDGWVTRSITDWRVETFPFWGRRTVQRAFDELRQRGLIETTIVPVAGGRSTRMRVDHEALDTLLSDHEGCGQNVPTPSSHSGSTRSSQNGSTGPATIGGPSDSLTAEVPEGTDRESREQDDQVSSEVERLCELLVKRVRPNTTLPVVVTAHWHADCQRVLAGVEVTDQASAELQLERVIEWATVEQFWRRRIRTMGDIAKHAATLWQQAQPWLDHGDDGQGSGGQRRLAEVVDCVTPSQAVAGRWAVVTASLRQAVDEGAYSQFLTGLHPHSLDADGWTVGVDAEQHRWVSDRFGRVLEQCVGGKPVRLVACSGRQAAA